MQYDVVLVVSPFAILNCPLVGPSVLTPQLRGRGVSAKAYYANIVLASIIGTMAYDRFTNLNTRGGGTIGEALFSHWAGCRGVGLEEAGNEIKKILETWELYGRAVGTQATNPEALQLRKEVSLCFDSIPAFLDRACADILSHSPRVVGFHTSAPYLMSPIALAKRLKDEAPDLVTVMGGPHATSPMGEAVRDACGVFDFVFSGEADFAFPLFAEDYLERGILPEKKVIECTPVSHLDDVSIPDYDDYFEQMAQAFPSEQDRRHLIPGAFFEASRGCWWGVNNACTFCGYDSRPTPVRCKSAERVLEEILGLSKRYGIRKLHTADVALPREYFRTLLPKLAAVPNHRPDLELNLRPDLSADELDTMRQAGVTSMLCGIESFSSRILELLNKGTTAGQNIGLLRDCRSRKIQVAYAFLMGVPGEDPREYRAMMGLMPKMAHLQPPRFLTTVAILRSSKYFTDPKKYGITNVRPASVYHLLFRDEVNLNSIAHNFSGEIPSEFLEDHSLRSEFTEVVDMWCASWQPGKKAPVLEKVSVLKGMYMIRDTRGCATEEFYVPENEEYELLGTLMTPRRRCDVPDRFEQSLHNLLRRNFVVEHEEYLISLVTGPDRQ